nr:MAG TPA: hypothetical protein [Crassvirales sp.]
MVLSIDFKKSFNCANGFIKTININLYISYDNLHSGT